MKLNSFAIAGPDGAGKSTTCERFVQKNNDYRIIYAGKNHGHTSKIASANRKILAFFEQLPLFISEIYRVFCYFPLEIIDYRQRFNIARSKNVVFDRHPIDRVVMFYEIKNKKNYNIKNKIRYLVYLVPFFIISRVNCLAMLKDVPVFVLLPDVKTIYTRSNGQYISLEHAEAKRNSYIAAAKLLNDYGCKCFVVKSDSSSSADYIVSIIKSRLLRNVR